MAVIDHIASTDPNRPPLKLAMAFEWARGAMNLGALAMAGARLKEAPKGDGRPVLLLPGLINGDVSNLAMRNFLKRLGYRTYGWKLGPNLGARAVGSDAGKLIARVEAIHQETGEQVTLIGVSLGGIMARLVAQRRPDLVREVITVSSPYAGPATSTNVWRSFEFLTGERVADPSVQARAAEAAAPLAVPATAIWSRSDGLVNGLICHDAECRSIEVQSSHIFVQMNPDVLVAIASVLAGGVTQGPENRAN